MWFSDLEGYYIGHSVAFAVAVAFAFADAFAVMDIRLISLIRHYKFL